MSQWWNFYKIFQYAFEDDPISKDSNQDHFGAGYSQDGAMPDIRGNSDGAGGGAGGGSVRLRDTNDFVDLSTVTNRMHRYKEYDRLRTMPEIEMALSVFADEACLAGETLVAAPAYEGGFKTIEWLANNMANERFLVYSYDFDKGDYTLAWAFNPRLVKESPTIQVLLDDGSSFIVTGDHRILLKNRKWITAGELKAGSELMAFYRIPANTELTGLKKNQFPRVYSHHKGWIHERQFVDEWRKGKNLPQYERLNKCCRMMSDGLTNQQIADNIGYDHKTTQYLIEKEGFSNAELKWLGKKEDFRRVIGVVPGKTIKVYDLSVEKHENFCTDWGVVHNCQRDENGKVFQIICKNNDIKEELDFLLLHRKMLNLDQKKMWKIAKDLFCNGDEFWEVVINPENPKEGVADFQRLPANSMYRIESTKGRLIEFQQSQEGPDYNSLKSVEVSQATDADLQQATALRFAPEQVIHIKIGDDRHDFYPYGVSLIEAARGPAHQLRLMEDAMVVYRLTRAPERRVFYIDVQQLPPFKAEALVERMKDQFRKKKIPRGGQDGASGVEERWHAPAADEDFWIPIRPNANTRVETLPGAQNLGEIDDTVYFRNKLFIALNFPKNYFNNEDTQVTRVALSAQDVKFARMIERLQSHLEDALWDLCDRHLKLRGVPEEAYEDLEIKFTPPSDWRELTRAEVIGGRIQNVGSLKGVQIMSDYDLLTKFLKYSEEEAKIMLARNKIQKLEELKMQIVAQNPHLIGAGLPGPDEEQMGSEAGPGNPMPGGQPDENAPPDGAPPDMGGVPPGGPGPAPQAPGGAPAVAAPPLPDPSGEEIRKYNLDIKDYGSDLDDEEWDDSD